MDSRNRMLKATLSFLHILPRHFSLLCLCLFVVFALLRHGFTSTPYQPKPTVRKLAETYSSSVSNLVQEQITIDISRDRVKKPVEFKVESRVLFTDHVLVILSTGANAPSLQQRIDCVYTKELDGDFTSYPMISADEYGDDRWIVQCPLPPVNYKSVVGLRGYKDEVRGFEWEAGLRETNELTRSWDYLAYEAFLDEEDTAVVLVKGLRLKSDRQWDVFKAKFRRRVSTFVTDWQEKQNVKSNDRAPGLGTEAIEPSDWSRRFCEVWDTRLKDFILDNLGNPDSGLVSWGSDL